MYFDRTCALRKHIAQKNQFFNFTDGWHRANERLLSYIIIKKTPSLVK